MPRIRVVLDACVLLPYQLADLLLRLADAELYEPLWSETILDEVQRNLVGKFDLASAKAAKRMAYMRAAFPNSMVVGYEHLVDAMTTDSKDRHVAAAAVRGNAALIVTANTKDFPPEALEPYNIQVVHPDEFLQDQLDLSPTVTIECLQRQRADYTRPQFTFNEFYLTLAKTVPGFAPLAAAAELNSKVGQEPAPLEIVSAEEAQEAFFPDRDPQPTEPLGAAYLWWYALLERPALMNALKELTWHPPAWGDYESAHDILRDAGMMQFVERCPDDEGIAYVKFMHGADHPMRAFGEMPVQIAGILTMILCPDGWWRAWGLAVDRFPSAAEIRAE